MLAEVSKALCTQVQFSLVMHILLGSSRVQRTRVMVAQATWVLIHVAKYFWIQTEFLPFLLRLAQAKMPPLSGVETLLPLSTKSHLKQVNSGVEPGVSQWRNWLLTSPWLWKRFV